MSYRVNPAQLKELSRKWILRIGPDAFNPDAKGHSYIAADEHPLLTGIECREYERDMDDCFATCSELGWDFYALCGEMIGELTHAARYLGRR